MKPNTPLGPDQVDVLLLLFKGSGFKSIEIPSSVVVLGERSFSECQSLESMTFESGSHLERIEKSTAGIPRGVAVIDSSASFATPLARETEQEIGEA
jgi:hypothetical protein